MDAERYARVTDLFSHAIELGERERVAFLARECCDDPELLQEVKSLLAHHVDESPSQLLGWKPDLTPPSFDDLQPGDVVRNFRIERNLGEGGMGLVYLAEQTAPVCRKVALKLMRPGMDTKHLLARFGAERQVLALMDHPCIAKVFDAGATESGRPYFVMEYVEGTPITTYCDEHRLSVDDRLRLFVQVCQAIQHAHQKGIIHRDIKPSNVLVTEVDGMPVPKVIDFGVAKALGRELLPEPLHTQRGVMLGTPDYMSPEQASMSESPDTQTDVYSLGATLYELLVGRRLIERHDLGATPDSIRRAIVYSYPKRPSARIRDLGAEATAVAGHRDLQARKLYTILRNELDWIVMRAIEKDRARRYASASELAADVERYLRGTPVVARPPTAHYRVSKYVRRHRYSVIASTAVALALLTGFVATAWQTRVARERLDRLNTLARQLVWQLYDLSDMPGAMNVKATVAAFATATLDDLARRRPRDVAVQRDLASAYEGLAQLQADPYSSCLGNWTDGIHSIEKSLDIRKRMVTDHSEDPLLRLELAKAFNKHALLIDGPGQYVKKLASAHSAIRLCAADSIPDSLQADFLATSSLSWDILGECHYWLGRADSAAKCLNVARSIREQLLSRYPANLEYQRLMAESYWRRAFMTDNVAEAETLATQAVGWIAEWAGDRPHSWKALLDLGYAHRNLAHVFQRKGDYESAIRYHKEALGIIRTVAIDTLDVRAQYLLCGAADATGFALRLGGRREEAIEVLNQSLRIRRNLEMQGESWLDARHSAVTYRFIAQAKQEMGDISGARDYYLRATQHASLVLDEATAAAFTYRFEEEFAHFLDETGDHDRAAAQHAHTVRILDRLVILLYRDQADSCAFLDAVAAYTHIAVFLGPYDAFRADVVFRKASRLAEMVFGVLHPLTLRVYQAHATFLADTGTLDEAEALYRRALVGFYSTPSPGDMDAAMVAYNLGTVILESGRPDEATIYFKEADRRAGSLDQSLHAVCATGIETARAGSDDDLPWMENHLLRPKLAELSPPQMVCFRALRRRGEVYGPDWYTHIRDLIWQDPLWGKNQWPDIVMRRPDQN